MMNVYAVPGFPRATGPGSAEGQQRAADPGAMPRGFYLLDLPGYGYARAAQPDRAAFRHLIRHVIERPRLAGVLWLLDIRREPSDDDRAMQELFAGRETRVLAALTKTDVLARTARARRERELQDALELDADQIIATSAREQAGIEDLREAIASLLRRSTAQR
jgi:GTP-binding protein